MIADFLGVASWFYQNILSDREVDVNETDEKVERLVRVARQANVGGVLITTQHNFAWLTGGRSNRIDASRETGAGALVVAADGRRFVLANAIEMPRLLAEELEGQGYQPIEFPWIDERADPAFTVTLARQLLGHSAIAADWPLPGAQVIEGAIARARALLTGAEVERYRTLGRGAGEVMGRVCCGLVPGLEEREIGRLLSDALGAIGARAIVMLVGADDRIARYRHPVPRAARWQRVVLVAVCAERHGLVVALSRLVCATSLPADLATRTLAAASVFGRLLSATRPGAAGREIFAAAVSGYAEAGYPGEERRHHQGGATGYRSREWLAHPECDEIVQVRQAFAWNPTITGTKIEETALVLGDRAEVITSSPKWPSIEIDVRGQTLLAPAVLSLA